MGSRSCDRPPRFAHGGLVRCPHFPEAHGCASHKILLFLGEPFGPLRNAAAAKADSTRQCGGGSVDRIEQSYRVGFLHEG